MMKSQTIKAVPPCYAQPLKPPPPRTHMLRGGVSFFVFFLFRELVGLARFGAGRKTAVKAGIFIEYIREPRIYA